MGKQKREKKIIPIEILKKKKMRGDGSEKKKKTTTTRERTNKEQGHAPPEPHLYGMH